MKLDQKLIDLILTRPFALATTMPDNNPNVIVVSDLQLHENQLIITDNFMNQTLKDISHNPQVALVVWNEDLSLGYKIIGTARYFNSGKWLEYVKNLKANEAYPAKGALLITITKFFKID